MSHTLYTFGYAGHKLSDLTALMSRNRAIVVDTRYKPFARDPQWRSSSLLQAFGTAYRPAGATLGNVNYKNGGPIELADEEAGLDYLSDLLKVGSSILLCVCRDLQSCHRSYIAGQMSERYGTEVVHL